jgi:phenylalanyl-tRNA synthetase beta chain
MKLSRDWLSDYVDLTSLSDEELAQRFTEIGHAVDSVEKHNDDTVFDLEITTNRVDAMSHLGMARELAAALGRELRAVTPSVSEGLGGTGGAKITIEAPEICARYSAKIIRGVTIKESPFRIQQRLEAVGLRPINNVVDVTNYVMMALGHPLHAFDLDKVADQTIIVRRGNAGEKVKTLDGETRTIDKDTVVIADARHAVALGGIMGGAESEIDASTHNVMLECAWFDPSTIRRSARRLGMKTDASYRFERRVDPNDTTTAIEMAAQLITELAGGTREEIIDVVASREEPKTIRLRTAKLHEQSGGAVGAGYALDLFRRLGFVANTADDGIDVVVPTYRGDIHEEMDLVEEVLRFFGLNNVPASLPRLTTGDARPNPIGDTGDEIRRVLVGCGLTEAINYSFVPAGWNSLISSDDPVKITNALSENIAEMRTSLIPGLLETVAFNRSYGTRDGALFEVGRTYHRDGDNVRERHRIGVVLFGSIGSHWGDAKRAVDFFDVKGIVEQIAAKLHVSLTFGSSEQSWLRAGKRAEAHREDRAIATLGFPSSEVLQKLGVKGDVAAAEIDLEALLASTGDWKMTQVARYPGVPMIMAMTHGADLEYQRIVDAIRGLDVPHLQEVGLRDRFTPEGERSIKTTLGMWYQAFDRSLTQEEVAQIHHGVAERVASLLPVKML